MIITPDALALAKQTLITTKPDLSVSSAVLAKRSSGYEHWMPKLFVAGIISISMGTTVLVQRHLPITGSNSVIAALWLLGFFLLTLNTAFLLLAAIVAGIRPPQVLAEIADASQMPCDLVFIVKNEPVSVLVNMARSLQDNWRDGIRLVLISNSTDNGLIAAERKMIDSLCASHPDAALHWQCPYNPTGRKHVALQQWLREGPAHPHCLVCDADSVVPSGTIESLLRKAAHPANSNIAVFQGRVKVHTVSTRYVDCLRIGSELAQRIYMTAFQRVLGLTPFFGHGALIRRDAFRWIRLPTSVLCHDIWEMALLSRRGLRVAFCNEVYTEEEFPSDYLESRRRDRRWTEGTLQSAAVLRLPGLSFAARFLVVQSIYAYVSQAVFLAWLLLGFFMSIQADAPNSGLAGSLGLCGVGSLAVDGCAMYLPILAVVFLHRFPFCRSTAEAWAVVKELLAGTIIALNGAVYSTMDVALSRFGRRIWVPMRKGTGTQLSLKIIFVEMAPSFVLGLALLASALLLSPGWILHAAPVLAAFLLGPLAVYWTSKPPRRTKPNNRLNNKESPCTLCPA